jgi:signal transduction histidine kinase
VAFYRIAQEALQNVAKHSRATSATVCLETLAGPAGDGEAQVMLQLSDNGRGFDPQCAETAGMGLAIMGERARSIDARLTVASSPGQGTQITLVWPEKPQESLSSTGE